MKNHLYGRIHPKLGSRGGYQDETIAYVALKISEGAPLTAEEIVALDAEIVDIKTSDGITLASLTCKLSLSTGRPSSLRQA